ncbi:MAG: NifU family protein [Pseudomonadota bacterium]|nr:NifU family protein [Pseudomonadota bacterium]
MNPQEFLIRVQPTPNPQALKFIMNEVVKTEGKATFTSAVEANGIQMARDIFELNTVNQLHFFDNFITVTFNDGIYPSEQEELVIAIVRRDILVHDANFKVEADLKPSRIHLSPEIQKVESILDRTIRPGLQGDGGDIEVISYKDHHLEVRYEGACGTCPSSTTGTLMAIESILRDEFDPQISVTTVL